MMFYQNKNLRKQSQGEIWKDFRKNLVVGLYKFILIILEEGKWDLF